MCENGKTCDEVVEFDVNDAFIAEASPLWKQLFDLLKKHGISGGFYANTAAKDIGDSVQHTMVGMRHYCGPERTPDELLVMAEIVDKGLDAGLKLARRIKLTEELASGAFGAMLGDMLGLANKNREPTGETHATE